MSVECFADLEKYSNLSIDFLILSLFFRLASACSHIAAVFFKPEAYFRMDLYKVASTSKLCQWKRSRQHVALAPLGKINFGRAKQTGTYPKNIDDGDSTGDNFRRNFTAKRLAHEQEQKFKDLKSLVPESSIFTSLVDGEYNNVLPE